jgi:hypothetical protein
VPKNGRHNQWNFNPDEQRTRTYLGMGEDDINLHDQWACRKHGRHTGPTREHLGTSDKVIMANRRTLLKAIQTSPKAAQPPMVLNGADAAALKGPDTIDCIAPGARLARLLAAGGHAKRERRGLAAAARCPPAAHDPGSPLWRARCAARGSRACGAAVVAR